MLALNTSMPSFRLLDTISDKVFSSSDLEGKNGIVVMFICNHCPYVVHVENELVKIANDFLSKNIAFVAISSNDVTNYPADAPALMKEKATELHFKFPYLYDETQEVAKAFAAACTPDFYVFNKENKCVYRGRMDGSTPGNGVPIDGSDLRNALSQLIAGKVVPEDQQIPSMGCNIKWK